MEGEHFALSFDNNQKRSKHRNMVKFKLIDANQNKQRCNNRYDCITIKPIDRDLSLRVKDHVHMISYYKTD